MKINCVVCERDGVDLECEECEGVGVIYLDDDQIKEIGELIDELNCAIKKTKVEEEK